ncbi:MAG: formylglycine-generating enzyme family protein [Kiritimatiellia bacterium]|jgi:formylglycine-generating enzyme required for sulfatase activity
MSKMSKMMMPVVWGLAAGAVFAGPVIRDQSVTMWQDATRRVQIEFTLENEPAIVTVDICTNGVSIGGENLRYMSGDVHKMVKPGDRRVTWQARKAWPGHAIADGVTAVVTAWPTNSPPDYMAISLVNQGLVEYYATAGEFPQDITNDVYKTDYLVMRKIPAGGVRWRMGSPGDEYGRSTSGSENARLVTLSRDFYMGIYPVTQRQYELFFIGQDISIRRPSYFNNEDDYRTRPVERVPYEQLRGAAASGHDWPSDGHAVVSTGFLGKLRAFTGIDSFDLPVEAEWEFACRAGTGGALYSGVANITWTTLSDPNLNLLARYRYNGGYHGNDSEPVGYIGKPASYCGTSKVGSHQPNAFGLYDMLGNVQEHCLDWYQSDLSEIDPDLGPASGTSRVSRGGGWGSGSTACRSAARSLSNPTSLDGYYNATGFRVTCDTLVHQ